MKQVSICCWGGNVRNGGMGSLLDGISALCFCLAIIVSIFELVDDNMETADHVSFLEKISPSKAW